MMRYSYLKDLDDREYQKYLVNYSRMTKETYEPYESILDRKVSTKPTAEILEEVNAIREKMKSR